MKAVIGIDRKIKRTWLDAVLDRLGQTTDPDDLRGFLDEGLKDELPGQASRAKSVGIALRIWSGIPTGRIPLRDRAIGLLATISGRERIWLHWGMTALAYPFFRDAVEVVGRLLALQDDFTTAQVQERLLKNWGDRATTREAAQKLLNTLVDWEVLRATKVKGHFLLAGRISSESTALQVWLLESLLAAGRAQEVEAQQLIRLPELFPFKLGVGMAEIRRHDGFQVHRQGLDMDVVALQPVKIPPPAKPAPKRAKTPTKGATPTLFRETTEENLRERAPRLALRRDYATVTELVDAPPARPDAVVDSMASAVAAGPIRGEAMVGLGGTRCLTWVEGNELPRQVPLSAPINECLRLCHQGRVFACIALTHETIVAVLRLVCRVKIGPRPARPPDIRSQFVRLSASGVLPLPVKIRLEHLWFRWLDYIELDEAEANDRAKLESLAEDHVKMLMDLVRLYFGFIVDRGGVLPDHPEYWSVGAKETTANAEAVI
jgi:hypothetical protein